MPTSIDWPTAGAFPQRPIAARPSETMRKTVVHFQPDQGPVISRRIALAAPVPFTCTFDLDSTQAATFRTFWRGPSPTGIEDGSLTFNFPHPETGTPFEAKIVEPPRLDHLGGLNWRLECVVLDLYA